jgi:pyrroline-5-carboxylate reductase
MTSEISAGPPSPARDIAFIGGGNMARSLVGGLLKRGWGADRIHVADPHAPTRESLAADFAIATHAVNLEAASRAAVWVLAVKPQMMHSVASSMAELAQRQRPLLVSIAAGITSSQLERWFGGELAVVRTMPNTPSLLGAGATGLYANARVSPAQRALVEELLATAGITRWVADEALMDTVTALSGSGPAYVFLLAEAMQAAAEGQGLAPEAARQLTLQTIHGAARMLLESGEDAATLRQRVTSPDGTTQAALESFESMGFREVVARAIAAATRRGGELSAANEASTLEKGRP